MGQNNDNDDTKKSKDGKIEELGYSPPPKEIKPPTVPPPPPPKPSEPKKQEN
jgi:hypothetical protein